MSNKDYTRYSNQPANHERNQNGIQTVAKEPIKQEEPVKEVAETTKPEPVKPKTRFGVVANCELLNIRKRPSRTADILCMVPCNSEVEIIDDVSSFYKVITAAGVEGFCMKDYVDVRK